MTVGPNKFARSPSNRQPQGPFVPKQSTRSHIETPLAAGPAVVDCLTIRASFNAAPGAGAMAARSRAEQPVGAAMGGLDAARAMPGA
ncbi:MAG: hypothetical protein ABI629_07580 [bacterium]